MNAQLQSNQDMSEAFIKNGIIEEIINIIIQLKNTKENDEQLTAYFVMIKTVLEIYDVSQLTKINPIMDLLLQDPLLNDPATTKLCLSCISRILRYQDINTFTSFQELLSRTSNVDMNIELLNAIQDALKEVSTKRHCQESFVEAGVLKILKNKLTCIYSDVYHEKIIRLWVSVLECVRFMIEDNPVCKKRIQEFDFSAIANTIRSDPYENLRSHIYSKSIESLLFILYENNNLRTEEMLNVKTPEVIPLVIELLADSNSNDFCSYIIHSLIDPINAAHFANRRTGDILLNVLRNDCPKQLLYFIEDVLSKVMSHHTSPQDLKNIIDIALSSNSSPEKQLLLYRCLSRAIENSFSSTDHIKFDKNHVGLTPTKYFCFRHPKCFLRCSNTEDFSFLPSKKEFSVFFWIYPEKLENPYSCLLEFSDRKSAYFSISIFEQKILIEYIDGRTVFKCTSISQVSEKEWSLIGITLKSATRFMAGTKYDLDLYINDQISNKKTEGSICCLKESFTQLMVGNNSELEAPFVGRTTAIYVSNKSLLDHHYVQIYKLSFQYSLDYCPDSVSTTETYDINKIVLREIYNSFIFQ